MVKRRFLSLQISMEVKFDGQEGVSKLDSEGTEAELKLFRQLIFIY